MEYKRILDIAAAIGVEKTLTAVAAAIDAHVPRVIAAEIIEYRGIELDDVPRFDAALLDAKTGYAEYILRNDMTEHIRFALSLTAPRWFQITTEHKYEFSAATAAAFEPGAAMYMIARFLAYGGPDELSLRNTYILITASRFDGRLFYALNMIHYDSQHASAQLAALAAWATKFRGAVPATIAMCRDELAAMMAADSDSDSDDDLEELPHYPGPLPPGFDTADTDMEDFSGEE